MSTVIVNACLTENSDTFISGVQVMLEGLGCTVDLKMLEDGTAVLVATQLPKVEPDACLSPPELTIELPTAGLAGVAVSPSPEERLQVEPAPVADEIPFVPAPEEVKELMIKSLSTMNLVPYTVDATQSKSILNVDFVSLSADGEYVSFTYCGTAHKFPIEKEHDGQVVVNTTVSYTENPIRVVLAFASQAETQYPCILHVADLGGGGSSVVLGSDLSSLLMAGAD